jgi:hypothetical protein
LLSCVQAQPPGSFYCDAAILAQHWCRTAGTEEQNGAAETKIRAERCLGEALARLEKATGGGDQRSDHRSHDATGGPPTLADIGITKTQYRLISPYARAKKLARAARCLVCSLTRGGARRGFGQQNGLKSLELRRFSPFFTPIRAFAPILAGLRAREGKRPLRSARAPAPPLCAKIGTQFLRFSR